MPMRFFYLNFILCVLILSSCASVYAPQTMNVPLLSKAREFQGSVQHGFFSLKAQAAYAITNHFAVMANGSTTNYNGVGEGPGQYQSMSLYEGAIGYYSQNKTNPLYFEAFLGYGQGNGSFHDYMQTNDQVIQDHEQKTKYSRYIFQPTIGYGIGEKKRVQIAFTPRISYLNFTALSYTDYSAKPITSTAIDPFKSIFFEPTTTAKLNFFDNRFFFTLQLGLCLSNRGGYVNGPVITYYPLTFSSGLGFRLGGLHWE